MGTRGLDESAEPALDASPSHPSRLAWLTSIDSVWIAVAITLPAIVAMASRLLVIDLAYHLRAGEHALSTGSILRIDVFSFVDPGQPWLNQQWGAQVVLAALYRIGGFAAIGFARAVLMMVLATFVFLSCRGRGADRRTSAVLTALGTLLALHSLGVRPQMFGLLLFAAAVWILTTRQQHPSRLWLLPPVALVWANVHGSFLFLIPMLVLAVLDSAFRRRPDLSRLMISGGLSLAATIVTPFGPAVWEYVIDLTTNPVIRDRVTEWAPLTIRDPIGLLFFASAVAVVVVLVRRAAWVTWSDLLWLGTFFLAGLTAVRSAAWWGIAAPVVLAGVLPRGDPRPSRGIVPINVAFLAVLAAAAVVLAPWTYGVRLASAPQELVAEVERATEPGDRLIVHQTYASWFEFALPDRPVFVDSRIELYPEEVWNDYEALVDGRADWPQIADAWGADVIVAKPSWAAIPFISSDPGWRLVFENREGVVFARA